MSEGWISLYRSLLDNWVWQRQDYGYAWVDLLLLANHEDVKGVYRGEVVTYERGTVNRSIAYLADRWGWSRTKTRNFLKALESDGMVHIKKTPNRTVILLVNYSDFQNPKTANRTAKKQPTGQQKDSEKTQTIISNNDNNDNNTRRRRGTSYAERKREEREAIDALIIEQAKEDIAEWHKEYPGEPLPPEMLELCERYSIDYSEI